MTELFPTIRHVARPAALFLGAVTVTVGTLAATDPAPAYPVGAPGLMTEATIAATAEPWTGGITFDGLDADADGAIGRDEFAALFSAVDPTDDPFAVFDTNGDEAISAAEWEALAFELLD